MYVQFIKRILDIFFSLFGVVLFLIAFIFVAPIIKITDHGPIFYNAKRIGLHGQLFKMYKFRSMKVDSPDIRLEDGSTYNGLNDTRVTTFGQFLRNSSIDELPQFINVLKGDMSIVGPRPDPPDWINRYPEDIKVFLNVRPGITGYSQAYFRNSVDAVEKMKNDVYYALNCSILLDVKILLKSVVVVLKRENTFKV